MSYLQHLSEERRLLILQLLKRSNGSANERVLLIGIQERGERRITSDQVRKDLDWLRDAGLITQEWPDPTLLVAVLTRRGGDVEAGNIRVQGVKEPDPYATD